ncbi:MAG: hypothetical protein U0V70_10985 [Terriglobia bacterium]
MVPKDSFLLADAETMVAVFPFLTNYDPPGTSEGALDPLGLYQIADQLAVKLVPAVRERMQRVRFLTAMAVGALVTEGLEDDPKQRDASPYLVWEWLVVEALIRKMTDDPALWGVPGTLMARRALEQHGYLDARSYLKTPRIFGFHGVYKRLAVHLGITDVHLGPGPNAEPLVDAWARDLGLAGIEDAKSKMSRWSAAVRRSLGEKPPRTKTGWNSEAWAELAHAFAPSACKSREKRFLHDLLHSTDGRRLGAFPAIWKLQQEFDDDGYGDEGLHNRLEKEEPSYGPLLAAIRAYEAFARSLQDSFDVLKAAAAGLDAEGFAVPRIASDQDFKYCQKDLCRQYDNAHHALAEVSLSDMSLQNLFDERFGAFSQPMDTAELALKLCAHHEAVQRAKSADGKRPWFDRIGPDRIYIRHAYREPRHVIQPGCYVHDYRGKPIRRFHSDLS